MTRPASAFADWLAAYQGAERLPDGFARTVETLHRPLAATIARATRAQDGLFVVGLCGAQGSGKTTMVHVLGQLLAEHGLRAAVLSLDDLYCTRAQRQVLAQQIHPLFATRGPPGTHDMVLAADVIAALVEGRPTALPRFDKARDDRLARAAWPMVGPVDVLLFEGWCMGARAEPEAALAAPVNALERQEDADGVWRHQVNAALAGRYAGLFACIDLLVMLQAPSFDAVRYWRLEQEAKLRRRIGPQAGSQVMHDPQVLRFVQFFERTTRQIEREMPPRADVLVTLDQNRVIQACHGPGLS